MVQLLGRHAVAPLAALAVITIASRDTSDSGLPPLRYRQRPPNPYLLLPPVPAFDVVSNDVVDGQQMPAAQAGAQVGGQDLSPHLAWSGFPAETAGFAVTMFDADAPTVSGFWHWEVFNLPASVTELPTGAGSADGADLPEGAVRLRNDAGLVGYIGAGPPPGDGPHRYFIVVHALDVAQLEVDADSSPAVLGFNLYLHTIARATVTPTFEN